MSITKTNKAKYDRKYYLENREYQLEWHRKRYLERREEILEYQRKYRAERREERSATLKRYRETHREQINLYLRLRKRKTAEKIVKEEIWNWESKICGLCSKPIDGDFHIDHIMPISLGGEHSAENVQLAHPKCNMSKGNRIY